MQRILIPFLALLVVLGFVVWKFGPSKEPAPTGPVALTLWGLEDENSIRPILAKYKETHPDVQITYVTQSLANYRTRVQSKINDGTGPDVFPIHNSWLPLFNGFLSEAPSSGNYYPVVKDSFERDGKSYAYPNAVNGLVLFVNQDILSGVGISIPTSWDDFRASASKVTVKDSSGAIKTAGAGVGTTNNVDYWSDILGLLLLQQPGVNVTSPNSNGTAEVLSFYTQFVTDKKSSVWDASLPSSSSMFTSGNLAFYFGYPGEEEKFKAANPNLHFKVATVPHLKSSSVEWANFWGEAVSVRSLHQKEAWDLAKYLSDNSYIDSDPRGKNYRFWYLESNTFDNGINDEMIKVWSDAVGTILKGNDPQNALQNLDNGTKTVLDKYTKVAISGQSR
jgi:ABC-type glycerol-3-phosphate transport system substrate-binding protein